MKGLHEQFKDKLKSNVVFYEWKNNEKYILDQYGRIYIKKNKKRILFKDFKDSLDNYTNSLIGMDKAQAEIYNIEMTKQL
jgi:hypothetical protein